MWVWRTAIAIALLLGAAGAVAQQRQQRHNVTLGERQAARAALDAFASPTLTRFRNEAEFRHYVDAVRDEERTRGDYYYTYSAAQQEPLRFAQAAVPGQAATQNDATDQRCIPTPDHPCSVDESDRRIVVTGSRVAPPTNPSITNNQMRGVEEGDIIKQIGHFLLVLQDGRIFVIDIATDGTVGRPGQALRLADRINVYRYASENAAYETWYDEMLVSGDRILVTGYSYESQATELAVFRLDTGTGRLRREGVFRIASGDYYDSSNYATRLIGDNLVVYTPIRITGNDADLVWPRVRRWGPEDDERERAWLARPGSESRMLRPAPSAAGPLLLDGGDIYRPVEYLDEPMVHGVSVCPLTSAQSGQLACRTSAMVGPAVRKWYVTADHAYIWTGSEGEGRCQNPDGRTPPTIADARRSLVYRVPLTGVGPNVIAARGTPPDQFAMQADRDSLYALVRLENAECSGSWHDPARLAFVTIPMTDFRTTLAELPQGAFAPLPGTPTFQVAAHFTERYLVYGGLSQYRRGLPDPNEFMQYGNPYDEYVAQRFVGMRASPAIVVPIANPGRFRSLATGHTVIRADRLGDNIILTGYRDRAGLSVTLVDLHGVPRIASSVQLAGRYESEGRSHAFNSRIDPDGGSLMGLPTVPHVKDSEREVWRSRASDLSFLTADRNGRLRGAGELLRRFDYVDNYDAATQAEDPDGVPGYQCEVSCTDWYGNSRPVFTDGRIFGLSGTELIEGRLSGGRIHEVRRLNIALSPVPAR